MKKAIIGLTFLAPVLASAQNLSGLLTLINNIKGLLQPLAGVIFGLAIIYFFWGVAKYILNVGKDPKSAAEGRSIMIWGIVAVAVMASIYGLVNFLQTSLGVSGGSVSVPQLP